MKTVRVSDEMHALLTARKGQLIAETGKMQTFTDVLVALMKRSLWSKPELLSQVEEFIQKQDQQKRSTVQEFVEDAIRLVLSRADH